MQRRTFLCLLAEFVKLGWLLEVLATGVESRLLQAHARSCHSSLPPLPLSCHHCALHEPGTMRVGSHVSLLHVLPQNMEDCMGLREGHHLWS